MKYLEINGVVINPDVDEDNSIHLFEFKDGTLISPSIPLPPEEAYKDLEYNKICFVNFLKEENIYLITDIFSITLSTKECSVLDLMDCEIFNNFVIKAIEQYEEYYGKNRM